MGICWITPSMFVNSGEASALQEDSVRETEENQGTGSAPGETSLERTVPR